MKRNRSVSRAVAAGRIRLGLGNFSLPSPTEIAASRHTAAQLAEWGIPWPPLHGWRVKLERSWKARHPACTCNTGQASVWITAGATPDGSLKVHRFCCAEHTAAGGFPWAGRSA